jgi:hypothetical protein
MDEGFGDEKAPEEEEEDEKTAEEDVPDAGPPEEEAFEADPPEDGSAVSDHTGRFEDAGDVEEDGTFALGEAEEDEQAFPDNLG